MLKRILSEELDRVYGMNAHPLTEISFTNREPYPFKLDTNQDTYQEYTFGTPDNDYFVLFALVDSQLNVWSLEFGVFGAEKGPEAVTNEFRVPEVMSTIVAITKDFIGRKKPNAIRFFPMDSRRYKLYMAAIKEMEKKFPEYYTKTVGNHIVIERKIKVKPPWRNIPDLRNGIGSDDDNQDA